MKSQSNPLIDNSDWWSGYIGKGLEDPIQYIYIDSKTLSLSIISN